MTSKLKAKGSFLSLELVLLCTLCSGCNTLIDSAFDNWDYNSRVHAYEERGMSRKKAERNAYEDQFFDKMNNNP